MNWFKKSPEGKFLWPGFGENSRVLKWIFDRCDEQNGKLAVKTPIGYVPKEGVLDTAGLDVSPQTMKELFKLDPEEWKNGIPTIYTNMQYTNSTTIDITSMRKFLSQFGDRVPAGITQELNGLEGRLSQMNQQA